MSAEPLPALAPASPPPDLALARCDADCDKVLAMIPGGTRVLAVGDIDPVLLRDLEDQDCSVVRVAAEAVGRPDAPDPRGATEDGFDVVLLGGALEHARDPLTLLRDTKAHLRPDGYLVVRVPNVAHGTVRLALLAGRFPAAAPARFFTYDSLVGLVEEAGFAVGAVEREEADVTPPADGPGTDPDLLAAVAAAPEARTVEFVCAAHPLPWAGLPWLQRRLRGLAEQHAAARHEADELRQDLDAVNAHVRLLVEQQEASLRRERELRAKVLEWHDLLRRRDDELREANKAIEDGKRQAAEAEGRVAVWAAETRQWYEGQMAAAAAREKDLHDQLARERHNAHLLREDRDALDRRLSWFRQSLPGRVYRRAKRLLGRGR